MRRVPRRFRPKRTVRVPAVWHDKKIIRIQTASMPSSEAAEHVDSLKGMDLPAWSDPEGTNCFELAASKCSDDRQGLRLRVSAVVFVFRIEHTERTRTPAPLQGCGIQA